MTPKITQLTVQHTQLYGGGWKSIKAQSAKQWYVFVLRLAIGYQLPDLINVMLIKLFALFASVATALLFYSRLIFHKNSLKLALISCTAHQFYKEKRKRYINMWDKNTIEATCLLFNPLFTPSFFATL